MLRYERDLVDRQGQLRARAASERERIAHSFQQVRPVVKLADRALRAGRALAAHPVWVASGVAALAFYRPRWVLKAASRLWFAWRTLRTLL